MPNKSTETWNRGILKALVKLFHFIALVQFAYSIYFDYAHVNVPASAFKSKKTQFGGKFKYLTFLDAVS